MERNVIRPVPINFALLLLPSIRWGNKMQYNTGWTCLCKNPYTPRTWEKTTYGVSPEFEQKGDSFLARRWNYMRVIKNFIKNIYIYWTKIEQLRAFKRNCYDLKRYFFDRQRSWKRRVLLFLKYCFDTWKLFKEQQLVRELLREKDDTNLRIKEFPKSLANFFHLFPSLKKRYSVL